ncbi:MAG: methanogenesis marker 17 protein [Candidatus Helarchaeota archaeon]
MSERVFVENLDRSDPYNFGIISYKIIADYVFTDLAIAGALGLVRILIDIEKPFFFIRSKLNIVEEKIRMKDVATINFIEKEGLQVTIDDESYAPDLLRSLWAKFGRENLTQLDRWNIMVPPNFITPEELNHIVIVNPKDRIMNKIMDAMNRIIPEAFRVRKVKLEEDQMTIIASENPIEEEWIEQAERALESAPIRIPQEYLDQLKQEPKKIAKKIVPWKTHEFQESIK